jgi:hypothetical protein
VNKIAISENRIVEKQLTVKAFGSQSKSAGGFHANLPGSSQSQSAAQGPLINSQRRILKISFAAIIC